MCSSLQQKLVVKKTECGKSRSGSSAACLGKFRAARSTSINEFAISTFSEKGCAMAEYEVTTPCFPLAFPSHRQGSFGCHSRSILVSRNKEHRLGTMQLKRTNLLWMNHHPMSENVLLWRHACCPPLVILQVALSLESFETLCMSCTRLSLHEAHMCD